MKYIYKLFDTYFEVESGTEGFKRLITLFNQDMEQKNQNNITKKDFIEWYNTQFGEIKELKIIDLENEIRKV